MERITATFDAETVAAMRRIAGKRGVSAFLQEAARDRLARLELLELLDELDAKHGAPTTDVVAAVDREAERIFGGRQGTPGRTAALPRKRPGPRKRP